MNPPTREYGRARPTDVLLFVGLCSSLFIAVVVLYAEAVITFWPLIFEYRILLRFHGSFFDLFRGRLLALAMLGVLCGLPMAIRARRRWLALAARVAIGLNLVVAIHLVFRHSSQ